MLPSNAKDHYDPINKLCCHVHPGNGNNQMPNTLYLYVYISVLIYMVSYVLMFVSAVASQAVITTTIKNPKGMKCVCKGIAVQICKVCGVLWGVNVIVSYCTS